MCVLHVQGVKGWALTYSARFQLSNTFRGWTSNRGTELRLLVRRVDFVYKLCIGCKAILPFAYARLFARFANRWKNYLNVMFSIMFPADVQNSTFQEANHQVMQTEPKENFSWNSSSHD